MKAAVIAAHPDDEILGCGGTIHSLNSAGHEVHALILGEGARSRGSNSKALNELHKQAKQAAKIIGIQNIVFENLPDNSMDSLPLIDVIKKVESFLDKVNPDLIFTHHPGDLNIDHGITFRSVLTAARPMMESRAKALLTFEVASSSEWSFQMIGARFQPNFFSDISGKALDKKLEAMAAYKVELRKFPHPRSLEAIKAYAMKWGSTVGMHAAEPFQIIWSKGNFLDKNFV